MFTLEAEERCGHLVTEDMKKLWSAQLELLKEFQRICKKHNIKYYAIEGTLLGAIRHNGYIPWDDDIDVGVYSEDFDRFVKIVKDELPPYYEFQHYTTQDGINVGISRIRDSRTTSCTKFEYKYLAENENYNSGIFIDIFPLFGAPKNTFERKLQTLRSLFSNMAIMGYVEERKIKYDSKAKADSRFANMCISVWKALSKKGYKQLAQKRYNVLKMFKNSDKIGMTGFYGNNAKYIWDKADLEETVEIPFEDITISCPKGYEKILTHRYGDYNVFVKGTAVHTFEVVDADTPYSEKLKEHYEEMKNRFN